MEKIFGAIMAIGVVIVLLWLMFSFFDFPLVSPGDDLGTFLGVGLLVLMVIVFAMTFLD